MISSFKKISCIAIAAILAACGGGGDSAGTTPATLPVAGTAFPVQSALAYAYTNGLTQSLNVSGTAQSGATSTGITGTLRFTLGKASDTTINSAPALQYMMRVEADLVINGTHLPIDTSTTGYLDTRYAPIGTNDANGNCVATTASAYPATAVSGQTGTIASYTCYSDNTRTVQTGTEKITYVAFAGSAANTLALKIVDNTFDTSGQLIASGSMTYTIDSAGVPSLTEFGMTANTGGVLLSLVAK